MNARLKNQIMSSVALITSALIAAACGGDADARIANGDEASSVPVRVEAVAARSIAPTVVASGMLAGKEEIALSFKLGGIVARVAVDEGAQVRQGQVLAELSQAEIASEVDKATQARIKAQRDLERARGLYRDSVVTLEQLQDATTAAEVAESNLRIARFNRDWSIIRAPAAGVILRKSVEASQLVTAGTSVLVMRTARKGLVLRVGLSDRDAMQLQLGDNAIVRFNALPGETFSGTVTQIASASDQSTGTYEVEVAVRAKERALASGLVGSVELSPRAHGAVPLVPIESLVEGDGDSATVYVVSPDGRHALRRRVHVAFITGVSAAITSGVASGDRIVTAGAGFVRDSALVRIDTTAVRSAGRAR
ncbi:MAG TPA: efflux RND transporter periplasmic adaptor subunit [Gemmatimonadaceae bacterium]|jgi:RND family efflux transporter MFP subunit|nr:efflux RND transporter periplasmic adaptor subunit [Gemmatimonadaceae bacterium]